MACLYDSGLRDREASLWHEASELAAMVGDLACLAEMNARALELFPNGM